MNIYTRITVLLCGCILAPASMAEKRAVPVVEPSSTQLEQRVENIERLLQNQGLLDLFQRLESLQREVANLRGQMELNTHELEKLKEQQRKLYSDVDNRLRRLDGQGAESDSVAGTESPPLQEMAPAETLTPAGENAESALTIENVTPETTSETDETEEITATDSLPVVENEVATATDPLEAQTNYQAAFNLLKQAEYDKAIDAFDKFLSKYPESQYSENAQYWMAEALYVTRRYNEAITEYMQLVSSYPQSQRAPNSLLKIGLSYYELGQSDEAKKILNDLIQKFPGTTAARDAEDRLKRSPTS